MACFHIFCCQIELAEITLRQAQGDSSGSFINFQYFDYRDA
jgi:hypothetical protein